MIISRNLFILDVDKTKMIELSIDLTYRTKQQIFDLKAETFSRFGKIVVEFIRTISSQ